MSQSGDSATVKYIYTIAICCINTFFGIGLSSFGPSFVDLKYILSTTMERISFFSFFLSVGYLLGSLFGFLYKYLNRQIVITVLLVINAMAIAVTPNSRFLTCLYICAFLVGMCSAAWSNAKTVWLIELWQEKSAPILHTCSFLFGMGTIIGPLLDKGFVTGEINIKSFADNETQQANNTKDQEEIIYKIERRQERLMVPFLVIGSLHFLGAIMLAVLYLAKKYTKPDLLISESKSKESKELVKKILFDKIDSNESNDNILINEKQSEDKCQHFRRVVLIVGVSTFLAFQMSSEVMYMQFSATYFQYIPLKLTAKMSAFMMSSMGLTFTMGRGVTAFVSMKISPQKVICFHLFIVFVGLFLLYLGHNSLPVLWTGAVILAYGLSPIICSTYCFLAQHIQMKNRIGTILLFSAESLTLFVPLVLGSFIEKYPQIFICVLFLNISLSALVFAIILFIIKRAENKVKQNTLAQSI